MGSVDLCGSVQNCPEQSVLLMHDYVQDTDVDPRPLVSNVPSRRRRVFIQPDFGCCPRNILSP